jgi:phosphotriesterase-related protein
MEVLDILEATAVEPRKWIFVHAQNEEDLDLVLQVARRGAWIELDGIQAGTEEKHLRSLMALLDGGFESQVMLSHDAGWYTVGEEPGAKKRSYTHLMDDFIPRMRNAGVTEDVIHTLTVVNPARAFAVG